tara:strand:+ start:176 stop:391 length:216 start_codon:yes stop_codon:yes gene_type:complete
MGFFPSLFGVDEQSLSYDLARAHSADIWFLKVRAWAWGITIAIGSLLIGNILGALGFSFFGELFGLIGFFR